MKIPLFCFLCAFFHFSFSAPVSKRDGTKGIPPAQSSAKTQSLKKVERTDGRSAKAKRTKKTTGDQRKKNQEARSAGQAAKERKTGKTTENHKKKNQEARSAKHSAKEGKARKTAEDHRRKNKGKISSGSSNSQPSSLPFDFSKFRETLNILSREEVFSEKYRIAARELEESYYHNASFETLELLADTYHEKKDEKNRKKILERMTLEHPDNPKGYYLVGLFYKSVYEQKTQVQKERCRVTHDSGERDILKSIEWLSLAMKKDPKYEPAYRAVLPLLRETEEKGISLKSAPGNPKEEKKQAGKKGGKKPEKGRKFAGPSEMETLNLIKDMVRYFGKPEDYVGLCEVYYKSDFVEQTLKACKIAIKKSPSDPKSFIYYALAGEKEKTSSLLSSAGKKFPQSEWAQFQIGQWFLNNNSDLAGKYMAAVVTLNPQQDSAHYHLAELLFESKKFEESYESFKTACLLNYKHIRAFQKAKARLFYKKEKGKSLIAKFEKGIDECYRHFKKRKSDLCENQKKSGG